MTETSTAAPSPFHRFKRLLLRVANAGPGGVLRVLAPVWVEQYLYELTRSDSIGDADPSPFVFTKHDRAHPSGVAEIDAQISPHRTLYLAQQDQAVAHRSSLLTDVVFPGRFGYPDAPVIGGCYTDPSFRGQGIYPRMLRHIAVDVLGSAQHERIYVLVATDNEASIRGIEKAGFRRVAKLGGLRIAGMLFRKRRDEVGP